MVSQYPHILKAVIAVYSGGVVGGLPVPGTTEEREYKCRYRPNTSAKTIRNADGEVVVYRGTCYIHGVDVEIKTGDKISIEGQFEGAVVLQVYPPNIRTRVIL